MNSGVIGKVGDVARRIAGAKSALGELHGAERAIRSEHERAVRERDMLLSAKPQRAEIAEAIGAAVAALAGRWRSENGGQLLAAVSVDAPAGACSVSFDSMPCLYGALGFNVLAGLAPGAVRDALVATIDAAEFTPGPALAERPRRIAAADERIAKLEAEHAELVDQAAANGLNIDHLPATAARRRAAAAKR